MALIKEYFDLTQRYIDEYGDNTILLMQVGSFFEVYGKLNKATEKISESNIEDFSKICELAIVEKNVCVGNQDIVMAGFKDFMIEKYLKKLQDAGYTAAVHVQDEAAKNTTRSCLGIFSPGTYFSMENKALTNNLTCIWVSLIENKIFMKGKYVVVGVANIDIYTGKTSVFQFKEVYINNPTTYDELERFISIYNPSEVIFISNLPDEKEMDYVISYAGINASLIHKIPISSIGSNDKSEKMVRVKNCEKQTYQKEIIMKFYEMSDPDLFFQNFYDNVIATQAFCFLLDFVYCHNPHLVNKISIPVFENCSDRLILANHSLKQLNVIDDNNHNGKYSSVLKMINECITPMGKRKFAYNFLNPTTNMDLLEREYDITEYFLSLMEDNDFNNSIRRKLSTIKDISKANRQIFLKKISPQTLYHLNNNLQTIVELYNKLHVFDKVTHYFSGKYTNVVDHCNKVSDFLQSHMNLEACKNIDNMSQFEDNFIKENVDINLDDTIRTLFESTQKLESIRIYLNGLIESREKKSKKEKSTDYVKTNETEKNNFSLLATKRRCDMLADVLPLQNTSTTLKFQGLNEEWKEFEFCICKKTFEFHKQTAANNSINNPQINDLCRNISYTKISMKDHIARVYNKIVKELEAFQNNIEEITEFITTIDLIYGKSFLAKKYNYCKPRVERIAEKSFVDAKGLRHCLIEQLQNSELYVTNDVVLGDGNNDGILLYGTNAVGKTSFIKSIGISLIMAQAGLYVPANEFIYHPYRYIFTRIIGNDNIFKGLSTFAVEMSELRTILKLANKDSLILGDELCSGTENTSAISIFVAGIQKLHECRSSFIFATHLHEVASYDEITNLRNVSLKHMAVVYDKERDMLIYDRKLKDGPGNSMYGLEVCKSLSLPDDFLEAAYAIRHKYHPETASTLSLKPSHYNSKKLKSICEKCGENMATEVHHLQHQNTANENGIIESNNNAFHKNNVANLMSLCEKCHDELHKTKKQHKRVKTTKGYTLTEI